MNKTEAISKINKFGRVGKILTRIILVFLAFMIIATVASSIVLKGFLKDALTVKVSNEVEMTLNPLAVDDKFDLSTLDQMVETFNMKGIRGGLNLGAVRMEFDSAERVGDTIVAKTNASVGELSLDKLGTALIAVVVALVLTVISVIFASMLCVAFEKCESPFEENVINKMRYFAYSLIPWALFSSVPENIFSNMLSNNVEFSLGIDVNVVLMMLVILALSVVFKYGAMLQQESDETL